MPNNSNNITTNRIVQLGYYNNDNLQLIPLTQVAQNLDNTSNISDVISPPKNLGDQQQGTKGIHLPLAKELLKYIPSDYNVLIVPVAYDSTGFTNGRVIDYNENTLKPNTNPQGGKWSLDSAYYKTLRDRVKYALDLNEDNKFLGVVWCQGESDTNTNLTTLQTKFQELVNQLATDWEPYKNRTTKNLVDKSIWYVYETTVYWRYNTDCSEVWKWYQTYLGKSNYVVVSSRLSYTNQTSGTSVTNNAKNYGNNAFINVVAPNLVDVLVRNNAIHGLQSQTTNFTGKRQYVDKYWNPYINSIEVSEENNDIYFYKTKNTNSMTGITFKSNVTEVTLTNIVAGTIILLEHTTIGQYSGIIFENQNQGNTNTNYRTVIGITEGKRLDNGKWDSKDRANNITVAQKDFTNGNVKIVQQSRGIYKFYYNDTEWFEVNLLTNSSSLKNNGINENDIVYTVGLMYGWTYQHNADRKLCELTNVVTS